jgi:hypothetical protein
MAAMLRYAQAPNELTARSVLVGLRALTHGATSVAVGPEQVARAVEALREAQATDATIDLVGSSGELDFDEMPSVAKITLTSATNHYVRPRAAASELYCFEQAAGAFCDTGVVPTNLASTEETARCGCYPF